MIKAGIDPAALAAWREKLLKRFPAESKKAMRDANAANAGEFKDQVSASIPRDHGDLAATLTLAPVGELGFSVSVGGPSAPYPLALDAGHTTKNGVHVPAHPFWFVSKRLLRSRRLARIARARRKALASIASPAGSL